MEWLLYLQVIHFTIRTFMGGSGQMCLVTGCTSGLRGAVPPGFNPLRRGWVYRPAPEAPILRGMPTGSEAFLEMPGVCGLRSCTWPHLKKGLVPYSSVWWDGGQIPSEHLIVHWKYVLIFSKCVLLIWIIHVAVIVFMQ